MYHRELQRVFRARVLKEVRSTQRVADKLRERGVQKYTRFTRLAQERSTKDKIALSRTLKDAAALRKQAVDKAATRFHKELKGLAVESLDKFQAGKAAFARGCEVRKKSEIMPYLLI